MGKGIGKLSAWFTQLNGGVFIVEFYNLRPGRAAYFARQISHKLPVRSRFQEHTYRSVKLYGASRTTTLFSTLL